MFGDGTPTWVLAGTVSVKLFCKHYCRMCYNLACIMSDYHNYSIKPAIMKFL